MRRRQNHTHTHGEDSRGGIQTDGRAASSTNDEGRGARRSTAACSLARASSAKDPLGPSLPSVCPSSVRQSFPPSIVYFLLPFLPAAAVPSLSLPKRRFLHSPAESEGRRRSMLRRRRHILSAPLPTHLLLYSYVYLSPRPPARLEGGRHRGQTERTPIHGVVHCRPQVSSVVSAGERSPHRPCTRSSFRSRMRQIPNGRNDTWREIGEAERC